MSSKVFECTWSSECGQTFTREYDLTRHINTVHRKERKYECTWSSECGQTFTRKHHLTRHISTVHRKECKYVCNYPKCGRSYRSAQALKRHVVVAHKKERNFTCSQCHKSFPTSDELGKHKDVVHGTKIITSRNTISIEKSKYECAECGGNYTTKSYLVKHLSHNHASYEDIERFECHTCGNTFRWKHSLKRHILATHKHRDVQSTSVKRRLIRCIFCEKLFQHYLELENHYQAVHGINLEVEKHTFSSEEEFLNWKHNFEDSTTTRFRLRWKATWKTVYRCHRSGPNEMKMCNRKRSYILRGSKKLNAVCPASITLYRNRKNSSFDVTFLKTHIGHQANDKTELKYCFFRPGEREKLAGKVASGIPKRRILNDRIMKDCVNLLYNFDPTNVSRNDLLTNKDLCNVESTFNVKANENFPRPSTNDAENVEAFVKDHQDSIVLYKRQIEKLSNSMYQDIENVQDDDIIFSEEYVRQTVLNLLSEFLEKAKTANTKQLRIASRYLHHLQAAFAAEENSSSLFTSEADVGSCETNRLSETFLICDKC